MHLAIDPVGGGKVADPKVFKMLVRPSLQAAYVIGAMHGDLARSACAIGCKRLFDQTQHWIVDHSPFHMNAPDMRSEEHTSELQSLMRISYAVFCLKKKN